MPNDPKQRIKILFIVSSLGLGGTERNLVYLLRKLNQQQFDIRLWCMEGGGVQEEAITELGIPLKVLALPKLNSWHTLKQLPRLVGALKKMAPDCMCCFSYDAELLGVPLGFLAGCRQISTVRRDMGDWGRTRQQYKLRRFLNIFVARIIANSRSVAHAATVREKIPARKVVVIPNGIPLAENAVVAMVQEYRQKFSADDKPIISMVGNYRNEVKGHEYFIRAVAQLYKAGYQFTAIIAGAGHEGSALEKYLHHLASVTLPKDTLRFVGQHIDISALLAVSTICVNPSLSEGMSNAILEYMAAGRAVVATAVGGTPEVVEDARTGILVPACNADALERALATLLDKPDVCLRMGSKGRSRVRESFSDTKMAIKYSELFFEMVGEELRG